MYADFDNTSKDGRKSRTDIPKLRPNYNYEIRLWAQNKKGFSKNPAIIKARTKTIQEARPPMPTNIKAEFKNGDYNFTWTVSPTDFKPDNFTLSVGYDS